MLKYGVAVAGFGSYLVEYCAVVLLQYTRIIKYIRMLSALKHSYSFSQAPKLNTLLTAAQQMIHNIFYIFTSFFEHNSYKWTHWQMNLYEVIFKKRSEIKTKWFTIFKYIAMHSKLNSVYTNFVPVRYSFYHFMELKLIWIHIHFRWRILLINYMVVFFVSVELKPNRQTQSKRCNAWHLCRV